MSVTSPGARKFCAPERDDRRRSETPAPWQGPVLGCRATIYSVEDVCLIADRAAPSIILTGVRMTELGVAPLAGAGSQISRTFIRCSHGAS